MKIHRNITSLERNAIKTLQIKAEKREIMVVKVHKGRATKLESEKPCIQKEVNQIQQDTIRKNK